MRFIEQTEAAWSAEQLAAAEREIEEQKREWEQNRLAAMRDEQERRAREMEEEADIVTFSREDATNQVSSKTKKLTTGRLNSSGAKKRGIVKTANSKIRKVVQNANSSRLRSSDRLRRNLEETKEIDVDDSTRTSTISETSNEESIKINGDSDKWSCDDFEVVESDSEFSDADARPLMSKSVVLSNHVDHNSPRTRSRGTVAINLWTLDVSPILPGVKPVKNQSTGNKRDRSRNSGSEKEEDGEVVGKRKKKNANASKEEKTKHDEEQCKSKKDVKETKRDEKDNPVGLPGKLNRSKRKKVQADEAGKAEQNRVERERKDSQTEQEALGESEAEKDTSKAEEHGKPVGEESNPMQNEDVKDNDKGPNTSSKGNQNEDAKDNDKAPSKSSKGNGRVRKLKKQTNKSAEQQDRTKSLRSNAGKQQTSSNGEEGGSNANDEPVKSESENSKPGKDHGPEGTAEEVSKPDDAPQNVSKAEKDQTNVEENQESKLENDATAEPSENKLDKDGINKSELESEKQDSTSERGKEEPPAGSQRKTRNGDGKSKSKEVFTEKRNNKPKVDSNHSKEQPKKEDSDESGKTEMKLEQEVDAKEERKDGESESKATSLDANSEKLGNSERVDSLVEDKNKASNDDDAKKQKRQSEVENDKLEKEQCDSEAPKHKKEPSNNGNGRKRPGKVRNNDNRNLERRKLLRNRTSVKPTVELLDAKESSQKESSQGSDCSQDEIKQNDVNSDEAMHRTNHTNSVDDAVDVCDKETLSNSDGKNRNNIEHAITMCKETVCKVVIHDVISKGEVSRYLSRNSQRKEDDAESSFKVDLDRTKHAKMTNSTPKAWNSKRKKLAKSVRQGNTLLDNWVTRSPSQSAKSVNSTDDPKRTNTESK